MIPSSKWFPTNIAERFDWYENFNNQIQTIGTTVGLVAADITAIANDATWMSFLSQATMAVDAYSDGVRQFRKTLTEGEIGDANPAWPTSIDPTPPSTTVPTGIFERLDAYVKRIRVSPNYTPETGALLGIIPSKGGDIVETEMKPVLKANSMPGSIVEVSFTRGRSDGITIETKVDNAASWSGAGNYFKSPASLNIPDGTGLPHSVQIRARYIIGNEPVGLNSDTVNVVTTP